MSIIGLYGTLVGPIIVTRKLVKSLITTKMYAGTQAKRKRIIRTNLRITAKMTPIIIIGTSAAKNMPALALTYVIVVLVMLITG